MAGLWFDASYSQHAQPGLGTFVPLADREVGSFDPSRVDVSPGRRLRCFAALVHTVDPTTGAVALRDTHQPFIVPGKPLTYAELFELVTKEPEFQQIRDALSSLDLRLGQARPLLTDRKSVV